MSSDDPAGDDQPTPEALPEDIAENVEDEFLPEDFEDDPNDDRPRSTRKRASLGGQMIGAAMIGLAEVLEPKPKREAPIEVTNPGKPLDLDRDGLDESFGEVGARMKGPPLDSVKAKARAGRPVKRRR